MSDQEQIKVELTDEDIATQMWALTKENMVLRKHIIKVNQLLQEAQNKLKAQEGGMDG